MPLPRMGDVLQMLRNAVAEFGGSTTVQEIRTVPTDTQLPPDPYLTRQTVVGQNHSALVMRLGPNGTMKLEVSGKSDTDAHRRSQMKMYAKRNKRWRETGTDEGRSTQDLANNPNDALDTETGI